MTTGEAIRRRLGASQIKNPMAIQPHLLKMFDNIKKLEFGPNNTDVVAMVSAEGETVPLAKYPKPRRGPLMHLGSIRCHLFNTTSVSGGTPESGESGWVWWTAWGGLACVWREARWRSGCRCWSSTW